MAGNTPHVLIAGGGVGGAALALFLRKAGISCAVYEAYPYTEGVGGGLNIAPNGMNALAALGLAETLTARGTVARDSVFMDERGRLLGRLPYGNVTRYGQPAVSMSRATLYGALAEELRRAGAAVAYEKRVTGVSEDGEKITARFADGSSATGDILIGADGVRSAVREYALPGGPKPAYTGMIGIGGFTPLSALPPLAASEIEALTYTFGSRGFFGHGGGGMGTMLWWSNLWREREFNREELAALDQDGIRRELLERYRWYHAPVEALIRNSGEIVRVNVYDIQSLPTWSRGRALLMGDAAHAVSPNSGQGASIALEDAMLLAMLIRDGGGDHARVFAEFERQRKPRAEKVVAEGRRRGNDKQEVGPFQSWLRSAMMKFFLSRASEESDRWLFDYRLDWGAKAL